MAYLSIDSISEGVGASQILMLMEAFGKLDLRVALISFEKDAPKNWVKDRVKAAGITWTPLQFHQTGTVGGATRILKLMRSIPQSDVIHGRSDLPTLAGILGGHAPTLWDIRSLWSEQRALLNPQQWTPPVKWAVKGIERLDANRATAISTLTHAIVPYLESKFEKLPNIKTVVPTCVNLDRFKMASMPTGELHTLLSGTFNAFYDLELTSKIIHYMRMKSNLAVTWARDSVALRTTLGVGEDSIISLNHLEMPKMVSSSHFGLCICKQNVGPSLLAAAPTKVAEFLASGRPVLVSKGIGDFDTLLPEWRAGTVVEDENNLEEAIEQLVKLISDPETPSRCRALAEAHFDIKGAATTYLSIYKKMIYV